MNFFDRIPTDEQVIKAVKELGRRSLELRKISLEDVGRALVTTWQSASCAYCNPCVWGVSVPCDPGEVPRQSSAALVVPGTSG